MFVERTIKKPALPLVLASLAFVMGCSKTPITLPATPTGMSSWNEVQFTAEDFYLRGNPALMFKHINLSGVPPETLQGLTNILQNWHSPPNGFKVVSTNVMSLAEYEASAQEFWKDAPPKMRPSRERWNITPEKVIVFTFASTEPGHEKDQVQRSSAAFRTNGLWYFAATLPE